MDVTPRTVADPPVARRTRKSPAMYGVLAVIILAIGFVLFQGLNNAALYYRNADEAIHDKASLGTRRFRVQGTVQRDVNQVGQEVDFTIQFPTDQPASAANTIHVKHQGDPPDLFQPGLPVVLEGHWSTDGSFFASDRILVKHSADYKASNPDHVASNAP